MKPNWYSLAAFVAVSAAIVAAHLAKVDSLSTMLISAGLPLLLALMPALVSKKDGDQ